MNKILSVSVAAYNVGAYLQKLLDSLVYTPALDFLEIIVVNDGSKDNTLEVAYEYRNKYPNSIIIIDKENGGYGSTINSALRVASGKYFKLLDGDDWYETSNLERMINFLKQTEADMVLTPFFECYEDGLSGPKLITQDYEEDIVLPISIIEKYSMHSLSIKTSLIKNNIKITEHCFYTDVEYFLKCMNLSTNFIYTDIALYCYRVGREGQSMSVSGIIKHYNDHEYVSKEAIAIVNSDQKFKNIRKAISRMAVRNYGYIFLLPTNAHSKKIFKDFKIYLKSNYPECIKYMRLQERIVWNCPFLYGLYSRLKRGKRGL